MNVLTLLATANSTVLLLLGGVALLLVTIIYGLIRTWRGHLNAGRLTVALALVACALVAVGTVQAASANMALSAVASAGRGGPTGGRFTRPGSQNAPATGNATPAATTSASSADGVLPVSDTQSASAGNNAQVPAAATAPADATQPADGTPARRFTGTRGAPGQTGGAGGTTGGGNGANGAGTGGFGGGNGNPNFGPNAALLSTVQLDQSALPIIEYGGLLAIVLALVLYFYERRHEGFMAPKSRGLLLAAAGFFVVIATLLVPIIPGQITGTSSVAAASAGTAPRTNRPVSFAPTATASPVPTATTAATGLPSLTPVLTNTPVAMPTQIQYKSTYAAALQNSVCTAVANAGLALRGDPSENQQAIGRIIAGSLLNVLGLTSNKKWLHIISTDNGTTVQGWVSFDYTTLNPSCANSGVPIVDANGDIIQSAAPLGTAAPTGAATSAAGNVVTLAPCTLLTTSAASLRPDPSLAHPPLASIPAQTALLATGKSANGQWWQVTYGTATGWIGAGAVLASSGCSAVPTVIPTPAS